MVVVILPPSKGQPQGMPLHYFICFVGVSLVGTLSTYSLPMASKTPLMNCGDFSSASVLANSTASLMMIALSVFITRISYAPKKN